MPAPPTTPPGIRIQKLLAQSGLASRRLAEQWIREGRVQVNGKTVQLGDRADPSRDAVKVDGRRIPAAPVEKTYLLLNKPKGYVTTVSDPEKRDTVMDLIPGGLRGAVKPVGRLDVGTEGLLLLTDDGDLARDVTHPSKSCPKEYEVKVSGVPAEKDIERLRRGIFLEGERTRSCEIVRMRTTGGRDAGNTWYRVTLREGKTRQIRRMFETVGHPVSKLKRVAIGPIRDPSLPVGMTRRLSRDEVEALRRSLTRPSPAAPDPAPVPATRRYPRTVPASRPASRLPAASRPESRLPPARREGSSRGPSSPLPGPLPAGRPARPARPAGPQPPAPPPRFRPRSPAGSTGRPTVPSRPPSPTRPPSRTPSPFPVASGPRPRPGKRR